MHFCICLFSIYCKQTLLLTISGFLITHAIESTSSYKSFSLNQSDTWYSSLAPPYSYWKVDPYVFNLNSYDISAISHSGLWETYTHQLKRYHPNTWFNISTNVIPPHFDSPLSLSLFFGHTPSHCLVLRVACEWGTRELL